MVGTTMAAITVETTVEMITAGETMAETMGTIPVETAVIMAVAAIMVTVAIPAVTIQ